MHHGLRNTCTTGPAYAYDKKKEATPPEPMPSKPMTLNNASFLGKMGYSTSKSTGIRQRILLKAINEYGREKVVQHIEFLLATRRAQVNGETKYANAIRIWESDETAENSV